MKKLLVAVILVLVAAVLSTEILNTFLSFMTQSDQQQFDLALQVQEGFKSLSNTISNDDTIKFFGASLAAASLEIFSIGVGFSD